MAQRSRPREPLITLRTAVLSLIALMTGLTAGTLSFLAEFSVPAAMLVGGSAAGGALALFHTLLEQ